MLDDNATIQTIKQLMKSPNVSHELRRKLRDAIDPDTYIVSWCIEDMEELAQQYEEDEGEVLYDRTQFAFALKEAIDNHDANYGISWDTLAWYLSDYCKMEK